VEPGRKVNTSLPVLPIRTSLPEPATNVLPLEGGVTIDPIVAKLYMYSS